MKHHDLIVIGTGSIHSVIDPSMVDWGIGLIGQRTAGGTCLNYGCTQTKMFAYTAEELAHVFSAARSDITIVENQDMVALLDVSAAV